MKLPSLRRVGLLMRHDVAHHAKEMRNALITISGVVFGLFLLAAATGSRGFHASTFSNVLLIGGFVVSSMGFSELRDEKTGIHYLVLPGSALEKYLAKLVLTSAGWTVAIVALYSITTVVAAGIASVLFDHTPGIWVPADRASWMTIATYLAVQPVLLFGSVYFRQTAFLKTAIAAIATGLSLGLIYLVAFRLIFAPAFTGLFTPVVNLRIHAADPGVAGLVDALDTVRKIAMWAAMPLFFAALGVLRLRETEV